ncbi:MAG: hypothetical protein AAGO57_01130 [Pseudomonadota bacterium]
MGDHTNAAGLVPQTMNIHMAWDRFDQFDVNALFPGFAAELETIDPYPIDVPPIFDDRETTSPELVKKIGGMGHVLNMEAPHFCPDRICPSDQIR